MLRLLAAVLLPVLLPLAVIGIDRPVLGKPLPLLQDPPPSELLWGGKIYTSREDFAKALRAKGASYEVWAERHPGAAPWDRGLWTVRPRDAFAVWAFSSALALLLVASLPPTLRERAAGGRLAVLGRALAPSHAFVVLAVFVGGLVPLVWAFALRA